MTDDKSGACGLSPDPMWDEMIYTPLDLTLGTVSIEERKDGTFNVMVDLVPNDKTRETTCFNYNCISKAEHSINPLSGRDKVVLERIPEL